MKNVFDVNVDKGEYDGKIFCTKEVSMDVSEKIDDSYEELLEAEQKTMRSVPSYILEIVCIIFVFGFLRALFDMEVTLKEAFANAPFLFVMAPLAAILLLVIHLRQRKRNKNLEKYLEENNILDEIETVVNEGAEELGIPNDSIRVDVLADIYEIKRGKKKSLTEPITANNLLDMYMKGDCLCFADAQAEFSIPVTDIVHIEKVKKRMSIEEWHKEEKYNSKKYKKYKIAENNYGLLIKAYYSIKIDNIWGRFEIRLPNYEEEAIMKIEEMTGKRVLEL